MVSSLLNKLANYTNLSQGAAEHEEAEDSRRRQAKVPRARASPPPQIPRTLPHQDPPDPPPPDPPDPPPRPPLRFSVTGLVPLPPSWEPCF